MDVMVDALIVCNRSSDETEIVGYFINYFNKARPQGLKSAAKTTTNGMFRDARFEKKCPLLKPYIAHDNVSASQATGHN